MFRALTRPSSGAYNCISSRWFYRWIVVLAALLVVVWSVITDQTTTNNAATVVGCGLVGYNRPDHDQQRCYHHAPTVKPVAADAGVCS